MATVRCAAFRQERVVVTVSQTEWTFIGGVAEGVSDEDAARFATIPGYEILPPAAPPPAGEPETGDATAHDTLTKAQLVAELEKRQLPTDGNKVQLLARLIEADKAAGPGEPPAGSDPQ